MTRKRHILLIDDDDSILFSAKAYLENIGYAVTIASSGKTGLEEFHSKKPDIVLTDLNMPEMDGLEVLNKIQDTSPDFPVIVLSSVDESKEILTALKNGAWDYFTKPVVEMELLASVIDKALARKQIKENMHHFKREFDEQADGQTKLLEENLQRYQMISQMMHDFVYWGRVLPDGNIKKEWVTVSTDSIIGYSVEELNQFKCWESMFHEDDQESAQILIQWVIKNNSRQQSHFRVITKTGENKVLMVSCKPVWSDTEQRVTQIIITGRDITEELNTFEKLQLYKKIIDNSDIAIVIADNEGIYLEQNNAHRELLGYSDEDIIGKTPSVITGIDSKSDVFSSLKNKDSYRYEFQLKSKSGKMLYIDHSLFTTRNAAGNVQCYISFKRDITMQRRSQQVQDIIFEIGTAVNYSKDLHEFYEKIQHSIGRIIDTTNFYIALYEEETQTLSLPYHVDMKDAFTSFPAGKTLTYYVIRSGKTQLLTEAQIRQLAAEGEVEIVGSLAEVWLGVPLRIKGKIIGIVSVQSYESVNAIREEDRDFLQFVSDQIAVAIDRKLQEDERMRLVTAIENVNESVVITDKNAVIEYVNQACASIAGYNQFELIGKNPNIFSSGKHDSAFYKELWEQIQNGKMWRGLLINKRKNGELFQETATITPIFDDRGQITNYIAVKRDVTEERKLQKQLQQSQKMEAIGTLAGGIAHDFNNILSIILGYTELATADTDRKEVLEAHLGEIRKAGIRAKNLVKQILTFSRRKDKERKPLQLKPIIKESLKLLRASIPVTIDINCNLNTDCMILGDPTEIHQIIMNLCTNAYHAMEEHGGVIEITMSESSLSEIPEQIDIEQNTENWVLIEIKDTGSGIEEQVLEHIFEPYFTTKGAEKGTGLGLSIVHGIVRSYGGDIIVTSVLELGTVFNIYLPIFIDAIKDKPQPETSRDIKASAHILFVDDEEMITRMFKRALEKMGYDVKIASNGIEALEFFRLTPDKFDIMITDMTMPKMTGNELALKVLQIRPDFPIILSTGFHDSLTPGFLEETGIKKLLIKPIAPRKMAQEIEELLGH
ncbi:MAG: response regulator [Candidatus Cloacimonetes bacterium]|nr:response regulator [Candidatus Cloacimonadota bacterium]